MKVKNVQDARSKRGVQSKPRNQCHDQESAPSPSDNRLQQEDDASTSGSKGAGCGDGPLGKDRAT